MSGTLYHHLRVLLPWSCLVLVPFSRMAEIPVAVMALWGLVLVARDPAGTCRSPGAVLLLAVFACMWVPILASAPDAIRPEESWRIVLNHLRFLLAGLFVVHALGAPEAWRRFLRLTAWLLALWVLDALVQVAIGRDLLGQPAMSSRVTGPFGERSGKFGLLLAVLAPLMVEHARACWGRRGLALAALGIVVIVLTGGTRSGWVAGAVVAGCYVVAVWIRDRRFPLRPVLATGALGAIVVSVIALTSEKIWDRFAETLRTVTGREGYWNPFEHRLWIWRAAWNTFESNPLNGVGARGFRHGFLENAAPGDPFVAQADPVIPTHPHQLVLEIAAETGLLGLAGLVAATVLAARAAVRTTPATRGLLLAPGLALVAALWPLNTHLALYSAFWSQIVWWLVALYCAAVAAAAVPAASRS